MRPTPSEETDLEFMAFITEALRDPHKPSSCIGSVAVAAMAVRPEFRVLMYENDKDFRKRNVFYKMLYRFIVTRRERRDIEKWMMQFSSCAGCFPRARGPKVSSYCHDILKRGFIKANYMDEYLFLRDNFQWYNDEPGIDINTGALWFAFLKQTIFIMSVTAEDVRPSLDPFLLKKKRKWPNRISSFLKFGSDTVIHSLLQWYRIIPYSPIIQLCSRILSLVKSNLYHPLVKFNYPAIIMITTKATIDILIHEVSPAAMARSDLRSDFQSRMINAYQHQTATFFQFIQYFQDRFSSGGDKSFLMDGYEIRALQICSLIISLSPILTAGNPTLGFLMQRAVAAGRLLYREFGLDYITQLSPELRMLHAAPLVEADRESYFGKVEGFEAEIGLGFIFNNGAEFGCLSRLASCQREFEIAENNLKVCSRCIGAHYCGGRCQRADWDDFEYPHRKICPLLVKIMDGRRRLLGPDSGYKRERTNQYFRFAPLDNEAEHTSILLRIMILRGTLIASNLTLEEIGLLRGWGERIYHSKVLDRAKVKFHPGYDDYEQAIVSLNDPHGAYKGPGVSYFTATPTANTYKEKHQLRLSPLQLPPSLMTSLYPEPQDR